MDGPVTTLQPARAAGLLSRPAPHRSTVVDMDESEAVRRAGVELTALAQTGLAYTKDRFDAERYERIREIGLELLELVSTAPPGELAKVLPLEPGYSTPKIDVRAFVFNPHGQLLLVQERDGLWSVPGGWCDVLETPGEAVAREVREETGISTQATALIGLLDRSKRGNRAPLPFHAYKALFLCRTADGEARADEHEVLDAGWFPTTELPPLSTARIAAEEVELALRHANDPKLPAHFD